MENLLVMLGRIAGIAGAVICLVAGFARILGQFYVAGFSVASAAAGRHGWPADRLLHAAARDLQNRD